MLSWPAILAIFTVALWSKHLLQRLIGVALTRPFLFTAYVWRRREPDRYRRLMWLDLACCLIATAVTIGMIFASEVQLFRG